MYEYGNYYYYVYCVLCSILTNFEKKCKILYIDIVKQNNRKG